MHVLIVSPKNSGSEAASYKYLFPVGLCYISAVLKDAGHTVTCLNLNHGVGSVEDLVHRCLRQGQPFDVVCTGGISIQYQQVKAIVDAVHTSGMTPAIVLGGGLISSEPELIFNALKPDFIVVGEGEETIRELVAVMSQKADPGNVAGIGFCPPGCSFVLTEARKAIAVVDAIPWPDYDGFGFVEYLDHLKPSDMDWYSHSDTPRVYPIITSRSCPYQCTFCFHPLGNIYRQRSLDSVMRELEDRIPRYRINTIAIYDELFSHDLKRVYEFCERMTQLRRKTPWELVWGCQMRVDRLDDTLLAAMKQAGCFEVSYGFESYSAEVLKSMRKHITPEQIDSAVTMTLKHNLSLQANFIFGDLAETPATARTTLAYWKAHREAGIQLGFINPYPGTKLYAHCLEKGLIRNRLDFISNHVTDFPNMSEAFSTREFAALRFEVFACQMDQAAGVVPSSLHRDDATGLYRMKVTCPHCKQSIQYQNYEIPRPAIFSIMCFCRNCHRRFFISSIRWRLLAKTASAINSVLPTFVKVGIIGGFFRVWRWLWRR